MKTSTELVLELRSSLRTFNRFLGRAENADLRQAQRVGSGLRLWTEEQAAELVRRYRAVKGRPAEAAAN